MSAGKPIVEVSRQRDAALEQLLAERIYEFNAGATGHHDGESLSASVADPSGATIAGLNGHTWGGCCEILNVWVHESRRGAGIGRALIEAAEAESIRRGCTQIVLSTHSFQAPGFYERLGFERIGVIPDYPAGHQNLIYLKRLRSDE